MNELKIERSSVIIAAEINSIKDQTRQMVLYNSIEIGKRLVEAKAVVSHGEWGNWLEQSVDYSQSTANNLMKIYEEYGNDQSVLFGGNANSEAIATLSYTKALALLSIPNYEREEFVEENNVQELSTRKLQDVIQEKKDLEKKLKVYEAEAEEHKDLKLKLSMSESKAKKLKEQLKEAETSNDEELIDRLEIEIKESNKKADEYKEEIKELEAELKKKPIEVAQIIEKVPKEIEKELEKLRKQVANNSSGEAEFKFKYQFESLVENFKLLLQSLENIQDEETAKKYKVAVKGLADKMTSSL